MRALTDRDERMQALLEYKRLHDALKRSLGVEPAPETRALFDTIRTFGRNDAQSTPRRPEPREGRIPANSPRPSAVIAVSA